MIYVPFRDTFLDFECCWLAISRPVEVGKSYIPQKKALMCCLKAILKLEELLSWEAPDEF